MQLTLFYLFYCSQLADKIISETNELFLHKDGLNFSFKKKLIIRYPFGKELKLKPCKSTLLSFNFFTSKSMNIKLYIIFILLSLILIIYKYNH